MWNEPNRFSPKMRELFTAIGPTAASVVTSRRAFLAEQVARQETEQRARELAALEERTRLARELHDSVSQALYGIGLGARTARTLLTRDPSRLGEPLDYILSLAEAGLTEMRALIFELRPESLEQEGLITVLRKQAASLQARHNIRVQTDFCAEPAFALPIKETLYRIAREALHNTVKHAQATEVDLSLIHEADMYLLEVRDNGSGFNPSGAFPGISA
ncbi:sensor histidine kinase [bacterium]|nr:sensor histidine kinase [bacterium]